MSNKKLPENATKTEGAELARRGRGEISTATAVPHVSYDDLRHADRITVEGLEVFANHGVYPEENALGQKFIVSLVLYADLRAAGEHDSLDASIDYGSVCHDVDGYLREHTFKLIEAAAEGVAQMLLRRYPLLLGVRVKLDKPWHPSVFPWQVAVSRSSACANRPYSSLAGGFLSRCDRALLLGQYVSSRA